MKTPSKVCPKCGGSGWVWWDDLDEYDGPGRTTGSDDTRYACDWCSKYDNEDEDSE